MIALAHLDHCLPRLASAAALRCLMLCHLLWPATVRLQLHGRIVGSGGRRSAAQRSPGAFGRACEDDPASVGAMLGSSLLATARCLPRVEVTIASSRFFPGE